MTDPAAAGRPPTLVDLVEVLNQQFEGQARQLGAQTRQAISETQQVQAQAISELKDVFQSGLGDLREETKRFAEDSCQKMKSEVMEEVAQIERDLRAQVSSQLETVVAGFSGTVEKLEERVNSVYQAGVPDERGREELEGSDPFNVPDGKADRRTPRCQREVSETMTGEGAPGCTLVPTSTHPDTSPRSSPLSPSMVPGRETAGRRKPQDFDGLVSLEAYLAQFELMAEAQGWSPWEKAVQLASSLKGPAVEVLSHLTSAQRSSYSSIVSVLERRYGHQHQSEVFRARFRARVRGRSETLQHLAQELETLARKAYPAATEDLLAILLRDQFVDALDDQQLQVYVKQAHVGDLQEALARALEFESFVQSSSVRPRADQARREFRAQRGCVRSRGEGTVRRSFSGECWDCRRVGHMWRDCPTANRSLPGEQQSTGVDENGCRGCGRTVQPASSSPRAEREGGSSSPGNGGRLDGRGQRQPSPTRPQSL